MEFIKKRVNYVHKGRVFPYIFHLKHISIRKNSSWNFFWPWYAWKTIQLCRLVTPGLLHFPLTLILKNSRQFGNQSTRGTLLTAKVRQKWRRLKLSIPVESSPKVTWGDFVIIVIMKSSVNLTNKIAANTVTPLTENSQLTAFLAFRSENNDWLHSFCAFSGYSRVWPLC